MNAHGILLIYLSRVSESTTMVLESTINAARLVLYCNYAGFKREQNHIFVHSTATGHVPAALSGRGQS